MIILALKLIRRAFLPVLALLIVPCCTCRAEEAPTQLDPLVVSERPYGVWGICWWGKNRTINIAGFFPAKCYYITAVFCDSPADKAGVQAGDELLNLNGKAASSYPLRDFRKLFTESVSGDRIKIGAYNRFTSKEKICSLVLDSGLKWESPNAVRLNYWGVKISWDLPLAPELELKVEKDRRIIIKLGGKKHTLIERPGQGVELKEGKAPGQLLPIGTSVRVEKDGSLTIEPPKPISNGDSAAPRD